MNNPDQLQAQEPLKHVHRESRTCMCYSLALEPDESCPEHGSGEWPPRCADCGKFMAWPDTDTDLADGAVISTTPVEEIIQEENE